MKSIILWSVILIPLSIFGLFLLYTVFRLVSKAILRSYYEEKEKHINKGRKIV